MSSGFISKSQMPFAYCGSSITDTFEHICHGVLLGADNHPGISCRYIRSFFAPGVFSCQHGIAGRGTGGGCCMSVGEKNSGFCQPVDIRGLHVFSSVTFQIAITEIISIDKYDVGCF